MVLKRRPTENQPFLGSPNKRHSCGQQLFWRWCWVWGISTQMALVVRLEGGGRLGGCVFDVGGLWLQRSFGLLTDFGALIGWAGGGGTFAKAILSTPQKQLWGNNNNMTTFTNPDIRAPRTTSGLVNISCLVAAKITHVVQHIARA